jgi:16S rRNA (cytosine967-C5)-methyltransferase
VLDACAAPGGKTTLMADLVAKCGGRVVAAEASQRRLGTLARVVARWGATNVDIVRADAGRPGFAAGRFDHVLVDAPCSGLGTLARHPDLRWRAREADLPRHASRQAALLSAAAPLVAPGGRLVYATCSTEPEENEQVADAFAPRGGFVREALPDWAEGLGSAAGGFFAASFRRDSSGAGRADLRAILPVPS